MIYPKPGMKYIFLIIFITACSTPETTCDGCENDLDELLQDNQALKTQMDNQICDTGKECVKCQICPKVKVECIDTSTGEIDTDTILIQQLDSDVKQCQADKAETQETLNSISNKYGQCVADLVVCQGG